jgi:16S rRNA (cytosine967-C5)-methyltransferase
MKIVSLLGHAAEAIGLIRSGRRPADNVLADFFRERRYLGARDRREISGMVFGALRHARYLDALVAFAVNAPAGTPAPELTTKTPLELAAYLLRVEDTATAEIIDGVKEFLAGSSGGAIAAAGVVEALQHATLPNEIVASPVARIATLHSFPDAVIKEWVDRFGPEEAESLAVSLNQQAPLSIRVNTLKTTVDNCRKALEGEGVSSERGRCSPFALVLSKRLALESLRAYRDGLFEMQDEGSQLLSLLVDPQPGMTVIDACAGGGGKTLHLAALMNNRGNLVAIDVDERKLQNLRQRAMRSGANVRAVLRAGRDDASIERYHGKAHAVLVDAPCSALGAVRRNPWLKLSEMGERSTQLSATQSNLLASAASFVKPGGRLVYSTCTLLQMENEDVVERFMQKHPEFELQSVREVLRRWGYDTGDSSAYLQLYPHRGGTDGFFAAAFVKR